MNIVGKLERRIHGIEEEYEFTNKLIKQRITAKKNTSPLGQW